MLAGDEFPQFLFIQSYLFSHTWKVFSGHRITFRKVFFFNFYFQYFEVGVPLSSAVHCFCWESSRHVTRRTNHKICRFFSLPFRAFQPLFCSGVTVTSPRTVTLQPCLLTLYIGKKIPLIILFIDSKEAINVCDIWSVTFDLWHLIPTQVERRLPCDSYTPIILIVPVNPTFFPILSTHVPLSEALSGL